MLSEKLAAIDKTRRGACGVCENTCPPSDSVMAF